MVVVARDRDVQHAYEAAAAPFDEKRGGLGLALPIARRVVERQGVQIAGKAEQRQEARIDKLSAEDRNTVIEIARQALTPFQPRPEPNGEPASDAKPEARARS